MNEVATASFHILSNSLFICSLIILSFDPTDTELTSAVKYATNKHEQWSHIVVKLQPTDHHCSPIGLYTVF